LSYPRDVDVNDIASYIVVSRFAAHGRPLAGPFGVDKLDVSPPA
jgi:hypothetical protein